MINCFLRSFQMQFQVLQKACLCLQNLALVGNSCPFSCCFLLFALPLSPRDAGLISLVDTLMDVGQRGEGPARPGPARPLGGLVPVCPPAPASEGAPSTCGLTHFAGCEGITQLCTHRHHFQIPMWEKKERQKERKRKRDRKRDRKGPVVTQRSPMVPPLMALAD